MREHLLRWVELMYAAAPPGIKEKFAEAYARRHWMTESELQELFKEMYREVFADQPLSAPDDPNRYERVDDVEEVVDAEVEVVEDNEERVDDVEEVVEDDEYVGQTTLRRAWKWTT